MSLLGPAHVLPGPVDLQPRLADLAHSLHSTHFSVIPVTAHLVTIHGIPDAGEGDLWKAASWARGRSEMDKELGGGRGGVRAGVLLGWVGLELELASWEPRDQERRAGVGGRLWRAGGREEARSVSEGGRRKKEA